MRKVPMQTESTAYVLDSGAIGAGGELSVNEDAGWKADLALERLGVEFVRKGCGWHCRWGTSRSWSHG